MSDFKKLVVVATAGVGGVFIATDSWLGLVICAVFYTIALVELSIWAPEERK